MRKSLFILITLASLKPAHAHPIILKIGDSARIVVSPGESVEVGHSELITIKDQGSFIKIVAKKLGETYLNTQNQKHTIIIVHKDIFDLVKNLQDIINKAMGLNLNIEPESCEIKGELLSLKDWIEISNIQKSYPKSCHFQADIHPLIKDSVYKFWLNIKEKEKWKSLEIKINNSIELSSPKLKQKDLKILKEKLKPWGLELKIFENQKARPSLVQVKLLLAEVSKSNSNVFGFNWQQDYQAKLLPGQDIMGSWLVHIQALESQGQGKILSSPTLVTESGGSAEFLAGGEFPIRVSGYQNSQLQWKKHGLLFKIYPEVDSSERIFLRIESEVSMLDSQNSVEGIPGLKVSRLNSQFNLDHGETIAISGLIQHRMGNQQNGISFIQNLPILGELFKSRNFQNEKTELIVFIQPLIYSQRTQTPFPQPELLDEKRRGN